MLGENRGGNYTTYQCGAIVTPDFDIPAGVAAVHVEIKHWRYIEGYYDGGIQGASTNNGSTFQWTTPSVQPFTFSSGTNFNSAVYWFAPAWFTNYCGWTNRIWQYSGGSQSSPQTSNFTFNSHIGTDNVSLRFGFASDSSVQYQGFSIREIEVYVVP